LQSYIFLALAILLGVFGQIGLKYSTLVTPRFWLLDKTYNEYFVLSLVTYFLSVLLYTASLKSLPLNVAYPSVSLSYVAVAWLSHVLWGTPFGFRDIGALLLILLGLTLLFTEPK
jgi:undecaprenyl phosphate-alpha-L-ara4N flippase subunit ArnE